MGCMSAFGVPGLVKFLSVARVEVVPDLMTKSSARMFLSVRLPLNTFLPGFEVSTSVTARYSPSTTKAERVCSWFD